MRSSIAHIPDVEVTFNSENRVRRIRNSPSNVGHSPIIVLMQRRHPHDSNLSVKWKWPVRHGARDDVSPRALHLS